MKENLKMKWTRRVAFLALASCLALTAVTASAQQHRWRMASAVGGNVPLVGSAGKRIAEVITTNTAGSVEVRFFEPGALVPALAVFDGVSTGSIDAGWHAAGYIAGKVPALQIFTGIPFGPDAREYLAWFFHGGGKQIYDRIYAQYKVKGVLCTALAPEAAGWFKKEINSVDDFKGLKFRIGGLAGQALSRLGTSAQMIAPGEIYSSLERNVIDGTENSSPAIDISQGYDRVAKNYYFPGWQQPVAMWELLINMDKWNALSKTQQAQVESACADNLAYSIGEGEAAQTPAIETLRSRGVQFRRLPPAVLQQIEVKFNEVVAEESAKNADFKATMDSLTAFRKRYEIWRQVKELR